MAGIVGAGESRVVRLAEGETVTRTASGITSTASANDHGALSGLGDDDHTQYVLVSGARSLTGDWDAGAFGIKAARFDGGVVRLYDGDDTHYAELSVAPAFDGTVRYRLPEAPGDNDYLMRCSTVGIMEWADPAEVGAIASGTAFPTGATKPPLFVRTDLEYPNIFRYDTTRSKWLAIQADHLDFGYESGITNGLVLRSHFSRVQPDATRGFTHPYDVTVTGIIGRTNASFTGSFDLYEGTTDTTLALDFSSSNVESDLTIDHDWTVGDDPLNIVSTVTSGTPGLTTCRVCCYRHET